MLSFWLSLYSFALLIIQSTRMRCLLTLPSLSRVCQRMAEHSSRRFLHSNRMIFSINDLCMYVVLYEVLSFFVAMILSASVDVVALQSVRPSLKVASYFTGLNASDYDMIPFSSRTKCPKSTWSRTGLVSSVHLSWHHEIGEVLFFLDIIESRV